MSGGARPSALSDWGCLLFQVGLATGGLPGWACLGNATNAVLKYPNIHKGMLAVLSLFGSPKKIP